jgi:hypothetical protein
MSKFSRVVVLVTGVMAFCGALAGAASATSWTNTGDTAFTATSGPTTISAGGASLSCTNWSVTGTAPRTEPGPNYTITGTMGCPNFRLGVVTSSISCSYTVTLSSPVTSGVTRGTMSMNCLEAALGCRITGTIPGQYTNATTTANGFFTFNGASGISSSGCIFSGPAAWAPNPWIITVVNGTGGNHPTFRFGPILSQP